MIIDIHAHLWAGSYNEDKIRIIKACETFEINRVYISSLLSYYPDENEIRMLNDLTLGFMRERPGMIGGFAHVDPRHGNKLDVIDRAIGGGMEGVKLWVSVHCDDVRVDAVAKRCIQYNVPILMHAFHKAFGQLENESTAVNIRRIALRYPELRIIMAHLGGNAYHGMRCIYDLPNVYPDISGTPSGRSDLEYALDQAGEDRILFGTDMPMGGRQCLGRVRDAAITEEQKRKILYKNALRVLGGKNADGL
ncbi:MAG: amidohydrolase [Clostridia bacterium]|nr:amidohydrolase [Clostridia bacterium]